MKSYCNLANAISASRLPLAIWFCFATNPALQIGIIVAAAVSDGLDGWVARKTGSASPSGAIIDPLFDRVFVTIVFIWIFIQTPAPLWLIGLFFIRDIVSLLGYLYAKLRPQAVLPAFKARFLGKLVTALQFLTLFGMIVLNYEQALYLIYITGAASLLSIFDYYWYFKNYAAHNPRDTLASHPCDGGQHDAGTSEMDTVTQPTDR